MPTTMQLAHRRVSGNKDCAILMLKMCGMSEVKLDTLDLWVKLQGYYFFLSEAERKDVDALGNLADRLDVTPKAYREGIPALKSLGFIQPLGASKQRLLRAGEVIDMLGRAAAETEGLMELVA